VNLKKLVVECIGTFFLIFTIGMVGALAPFAIGAVLMTQIFAGGHISGAHYNPAVSLAVFLRGKSTVQEMLGYWAAQIVGAAVASAIVLFLKGAPGTAGSIDVVKALIVEFLFTFALCYVILNVATAKGTAGNSFYGLAIGFTVLAGAFAVGPVSGGAFNPAVAIGVTIMGLANPANIWVYLIGNLAGGAVAAYTFRALNPEDK
jgi:aquaporin Z